MTSFTDWLVGHLLRIGAEAVLWANKGKQKRALPGRQFSAHNPDFFSTLVCVMFLGDERSEEMMPLSMSTV